MSVMNPLAGAVAALGKAGNFTKSVEGKSTGMYGGAPAQAITRPIAPTKPIAGAGTGFGDDIAAGLAAKKANVDAVSQRPTQTFSKGGKFKKDGVQTVKAEKGETVLPVKGSRKKAMELAMKHLDGMKDGMEASKKKKSAKSEKSEKSEKKESKHKKVHPWKRTEIEHHVGGGHTMRQFHDTDSSQDTSSAHADDASMMGALQGSMNAGPQTMAGASAAPAAGAAPEAPAAPGAPA
jgi:hypothetical protein